MNRYFTRDDVGMANKACENIFNITGHMGNAN